VWHTYASSRHCQRPATTPNSKNKLNPQLQKQTELNPYAILTLCHIMGVFGSSPRRQLAGQAAIPASRDRNRMPGLGSTAQLRTKHALHPNKQAHADCQSMQHIQPMCRQTNGACSARTAITAQRFRPYSLQLSFFFFSFHFLYSPLHSVYLTCPPTWGHGGDFGL
jgi:hypothetical protein